MTSSQGAERKAQRQALEACAATVVDIGEGPLDAEEQILVVAAVD